MPAKPSQGERCTSGRRVGGTALPFLRNLQRRTEILGVKGTAARRTLRPLAALLLPFSATPVGTQTHQLSMGFDRCRPSPVPWLSWRVRTGLSSQSQLERVTTPVPLRFHGPHILPVVVSCTM